MDRKLGLLIAQMNLKEDLNRHKIEVGFAPKSDSSPSLKEIRIQINLRISQAITRIASMATDAAEDRWYDFKSYWAAIRYK